MSVTNSKNLSITITGIALDPPHKRIPIKLEIEPHNALIQSDGLLLAFKNERGTYFFHDGLNTHSEMAKKILNAAKNISPFTAANTLGGVGGMAGLSKNKNTAIAGGIVGVVLGLSIPSIVDYFDNTGIQEGYYRNKRLIYPDMIYLKLS